ncbi:hypothetical protein EYW49_05450 [Siculibacillus lacustris]|uniref:Uncharacterized protein n=1 Tax=Siculibacillus lacustris TaxID=1549641 RepID=A0A4Q9VW68_9HYPH|nr:hypothetical protein [Siculibacillus lacustris]TBW40110.1 hypothetical protein EYW49_05450 [Siculibacillus lacustris]
MALPRESYSHELRDIKSKIEGMNIHEIKELPNLRQSDFATIGIVIQSFCFIDLNIRRVHESIKLLNNDNSKSKNRDVSDLLKYIETATINNTDAMNIIFEVKSLCRYFESVRPYRNAFAHLAMKLNNEMNEYVFLTKDNKDSLESTGRITNTYELIFGICRISDIEIMIRDLLPRQERLASAVIALHKITSEKAENRNSR